MQKFCENILVLVLLLGINSVELQSRNYGSDQWSRDYDYYRPRGNPAVCSSQTCRLPKCFCAGKEAPRRMDPGALPQMVMFTFDDAVNEQVFDYYTELFPQNIVNPNGCPVSVTYFISHNWTNYDMVKELYDKGHEIGSHSITHRMPQSWWRYGPAEDWEKEIQGQRENLVKLASIPEEEIRGMRAPFLDTGGDEQYKMMEKYGFEYDASFMTGPHDKGGAWPFTLDFVPSWEYCTNLNCPKERHPKIWEVPLNRWVGIDGNGCSMVDACQQQPRHKGETLAYLWQNFNRHYYGNRSPVGVNMHATWFKTPHHFEAMKEFIQKISEMDDVYILSVNQILEWMKNPQTIDRVVNFGPWLKSCKGNQPRVAENNEFSNEINNEQPNTAYNVYDNTADEQTVDFPGERPVQPQRNNRLSERRNSFRTTGQGQTQENSDTNVASSRDTNGMDKDSQFEMYLEESMEKEERLLPKVANEKEFNAYGDYENTREMMDTEVHSNRNIENIQTEIDAEHQKNIHGKESLRSSGKSGTDADVESSNIIYETKSQSEVLIISEDESSPENKEDIATMTKIGGKINTDISNMNKTSESKDVTKSPAQKPPTRQRPRQNRPLRPNSVQGRLDHQSRYRENQVGSASSLTPVVNVMVLAASGKLAVYVYHQLAWV